MGIFLELSSIINRNAQEVINSLKNYLNTVEGGIAAANIDSNHKNFCAVTEANGSTTILYPSNFLNWDEAAQFISKDLGAAVFSFHIHDGDLWMYTLFADGRLKDQFCPMPEYWDDEISQEEMESWKGNPNIIAKYVPGVLPETIERYLIHWNEDQEGKKAYADDQYTNCDWQLIDFMQKLKLPYPIDNQNHIQGQTFKFWTKELPLAEPGAATPNMLLTPTEEQAEKKPWWKLW